MHTWRGERWNISAALKITLLFLFIFSQLKTEEKEKSLADVKTRLKISILNQNFWSSETLSTKHSKKFEYPGLMYSQRFSPFFMEKRLDLYEQVEILQQRLSKPNVFKQPSTSK